ncbi:MAG TPA: T9SS type A sorting domain-containing protein [Candidatus Kapabacteria bacterium]|jgi:hypothetical protein
MRYRVIALGVLFSACLAGRLRSQSMTVSELMPLAVGQYVEYNEYDTAASSDAPSKSFAYYEGIQSGFSFEGETGVALVRDTLGNGDPFGAHNIHYSFTSAGDLQAYADSAFVADLIPNEIVAGITKMPNAWEDYFKLTVEENSYPIMTLNSSVTVDGTMANVTVTVSGMYKGIKTVTLSKGTYNNAYQFDIQAIVNISALGGLIKGSFTSIQSNWFVPGIGIIKTNAPIAGTTIQGNTISTVGREKEMVADGNAYASVPFVQHLVPYIHIYPNPASNEATFTFDRSARQIFLFNPLGELVRSFDIATESGIALLGFDDLPNGMYFARVYFVDGSTGATELIVQH